jgi:NADH-quinone oxidoreductase subunit L
MYNKKWISAEKVGSMFKPVYTVLSRKYWMDELYENIFVYRILHKGLFAAFAFFDSRVVDGAVNTLANSTSNASKGIRKIQTGQLQAYAMAIAIGVVAILIFVLIFG